MVWDRKGPFHTNDPLQNPLYLRIYTSFHEQFNSVHSQHQPIMASITEVRFLIISDTHDLDFYSEDPNQPFRNGCVPKVDVVLHCGDFTENGSPNQLRRAITWLGSIEAELKLLIAGNHEASLDREFFVNQGGDAVEHEKVTNLATRLSQQHGVRFLNEGTYKFILSSGATFTLGASPYTPEVGVSAFQYPTSHDRYNSPDHVLPWAKSTPSSDYSSIFQPNTDIIMTHGPPKYILDTTEESSSGGCAHLRQAICRIRPRLHCFGHIHCGYGIKRVKWETDGDEQDQEKTNTSTSNHQDYSRKRRWDRTAAHPMFKNQKQKKEDNDDNADMIHLLEEFVGKAQARKKGYAALGRPSEDDFRTDKNQTLFVNAAIMDTQGKPSNPPWLVCLDLPISLGTSEEAKE